MPISELVGIDCKPRYRLRPNRAGRLIVPLRDNCCSLLTSDTYLATCYIKLNIFKREMCVLDSSIKNSPVDASRRSGPALCGRGEFGRGLRQKFLCLRKMRTQFEYETILVFGRFRKPNREQLADLENIRSDTEPRIIAINSSLRQLSLVHGGNQRNAN